MPPPITRAQSPLPRTSKHRPKSIVCKEGSVLRVGPNDTYSTSVFDEISAVYRNLRRLNLHEHEPQLARKTLVHPAQNPAQNRHYSSNARGRYPRRCPTGVSLTRGHVSVPWGVKSITNSSRYNAQRDKSLSYIIAVSELANI